ncbi:FMN-dependent NADH-azoreductase [Protaetiibacter larvae]|uniref:FMN dependent NADH:quinone oxidoreductase n=1 Tax=Protaetiibacter larvae TaxID=2592654 RepID=A0A5C1Y646_9MICO|nr:NAD(P)H-dependent oxidoreductase [Protaetiibacter larvae]QEO08779.1 flavodoxin family protein [Protaetiibacter larvae]
MTRLLHLSASPRGEASESLALARRYLDTVRAARPDVVIDEWDLWDGSLPSFGPDGAGAKMRIFAGEDPVGPQEVAWHRARLAFERFAAADHYLFSVPMWNASVPYILKQFIDVVSQPGMVFGFHPVDGYSGLLRGRSASAIYTGAVYGEDRGPAFGSDFQQPYLEDWLRWTGIDDIRAVAFRPNLATADADAGRRAAQADAVAAAQELLRRIARAS